MEKELLNKLISSSVSINMISGRSINGILVGYDVNYVFVQNVVNRKLVMVKKDSIKYIEPTDIATEKIKFANMPRSEIKFYESVNNKEITVYFTDGRSLTGKFNGYDLNVIMIDNKIIYKANVESIE